MVKYVFDSSAVLRYLDREAGWERVKSILHDRSASQATLLIPAVQWGEIAGKVRKKDSNANIQQVLRGLTTVGLQPAPVSPEQAVRAAMLRLDFGLPYADAMLAALALELDQAVLITADFDFRVIEHLLTIEFLPAKPALPAKQP